MLVLIRLILSCFVVLTCAAGMYVQNHLGNDAAFSAYFTAIIGWAFIAVNNVVEYLNI